MAITRTDGEAEAAIKRSRGIEVAYRMHDVVEPARHFSEEPFAS